jgi:hypothetical protein
MWATATSIAVDQVQARTVCVQDLASITRPRSVVGDYISQPPRGAGVVAAASTRKFCLGAVNEASYIFLRDHGISTLIQPMGLGRAKRRRRDSHPPPLVLLLLRLKGCHFRPLPPRPHAATPHLRCNRGRLGGCWRQTSARIVENRGGSSCKTRRTGNRRYHLRRPFPKGLAPGQS